MAPRGAFAAIRRPSVKCEAGRSRGGARARTFWSSGGLVRVVKRSPARSALAHPRRRARTPNGLPSATITALAAAALATALAVSAIIPNVANATFTSAVTGASVPAAVAATAKPTHRRLPTTLTASF